MTLTIKKSRPIIVDDVSYRYQVSTTLLDNNWNFTLNLTVQSELDKGCFLQTKGLVTRDCWLDISDTGTTWDEGAYPVILPRHVSKIVKKAISDDWLPQDSGKPYIVKIANKWH